MTTKLFLDTEFTGLHQDTTLISLALVTETGEEFYAEFTDYDPKQINQWIKENVIDHLTMTDSGITAVKGDIKIRGTKECIVPALIVWLAQFDALEIWSDTLAYDWMLFCQLFGGALNLPKNVFYIPYDLATAFKILGIDPDVNREDLPAANGWLDTLPKHNALHDARVQQECYRILSNAVAESTKRGELKLGLEPLVLVVEK